MFFRKLLTKKLTLIDLVKKETKTDFLFNNIMGDLGIAAEKIMSNTPLIQMSYAYARRDSAAAMHAQGLYHKDDYDYVISMFKIFQQKTGSTVEFQELAAAESLEFMKNYSHIVSGLLIKKIIQIANFYDVPGHVIHDSEFFEGVISTIKKENDEEKVLQNEMGFSKKVSWEENLIEWAKKNNLPNRELVNDEFGGNHYTGFTSDKESIDYINLFNTFSKGDVFEIEGALTIDLNHHNLTELPIEFFNLIGIHNLHLHTNKLEKLPEEIGNLVNLIKLDLGNNSIKNIPKSISKLKHLEYLGLFNSGISFLPDEIINLPSLTGINIAGNPNLKLTEYQKNWISSLNEYDVRIDEDLLDR